jgi:cysteine desulfurase family protein
MRVYLDNAATSWPKPEPVYQAVDTYQRTLGTSAGRGSYRAGQQAQRTLDQTRAACATLLGCRDPRQLLFTAGGTAALNLAIHGVLRPGDQVVTTVAEHNSVLRPLHWQAQAHGAQLRTVGCDPQGYIDLAALEQALRPDTRLVVVTHASNVTGALQPIARIAELVRRHSPALLLVDAAQTAGCVPIDVDHWGMDLLACGGHKGLLGPLGTGLLYVRPGLEQQLRPLTQGGTGTDSLALEPPAQLPERFETGSLNLPALAGLGAAVRCVAEQTVEALQQHHHALADQLLSGLAAIAQLRVFGPPADQPRVGVVSCAVEGYSPHEFAAALDAGAGVECRAGLHCAPQMHAALGTDTLGGLVRFSPGWSTTPQEIDAALTAIAALVAAPVC